MHSIGCANCSTGQLEASILDPWTGKLHQASASMWRWFGADRMIEKGQAPIPRSSNTGKLLVKRFGGGKSAYQADAGGQNPRGNPSLERKNSDRKSGRGPTGMTSCAKDSQVTM
jgi:hypothetical protein